MNAAQQVLVAGGHTGTVRASANEVFIGTASCPTKIFLLTRRWHTTCVLMLMAMAELAAWSPETWKQLRISEDQLNKVILHDMLACCPLNHITQARRANFYLGLTDWWLEGDSKPRASSTVLDKTINDVSNLGRVSGVLGNCLRCKQLCDTLASAWSESFDFPLARWDGGPTEEQHACSMADVDTTTTTSRRTSTRGAAAATVDEVKSQVKGQGTEKVTVLLLPSTVRYPHLCLVGCLAWDLVHSMREEDDMSTIDCLTYAFEHWRILKNIRQNYKSEHPKLSLAPQVSRTL
eukprot:747574-Hanusia_phi.AAC.6